MTPNSAKVPLIGQTNIIWSESRSALQLPQTLSGEPLQLDPLLKDPAHGNFALRKGSAAIGAGTPDGLAWDIRGVPRAPGEKPDIGALQHDPEAFN